MDVSKILDYITDAVGSVPQDSHLDDFEDYNDSVEDDIRPAIDLS